MKRYIGIVFDNYTPQVESQMTKDFIAIKYAYNNQVIACCADVSVVSTALQALQIQVIPNMDLPTQCLVYKTTQEWPEVPDNCTDKIERDLYVSVKDSKLVSNPNDKGYYLPQWGRPYVSDIHRMNYRPNGFGPPDPAIKLLWG